MNKNLNLLHAAGLDTEGWSEASIIFFAKEIRERLAPWQLRLVERLGWYWLLAISGLETRQTDEGQGWQTIFISRDGDSIKATDLV